MNTKDLFLVGAGVAIGYLLVVVMNKNKAIKEATVETGATGATGIVDLVAEQSKIDSCNKMVSDYMATARFAKGTDLEAIAKEKYDACMSAQ